MKALRLFAFFAIFGMVATTCCADVRGYSFQGSFSQDNQTQLFDIGLASASVVTLQTWSYAGGVDWLGNTIAPGGFAPEITVFDTTGNEIAFDNGGSAPACGGRNVDPVTGFCLDASIYDGVNHPLLFLGAGTYTVALTQQGNDPLGQLSAGFSQDAANGDNPSFTGTNAGRPGAMFLDPFDAVQRSGEWEVDITGDEGLSVSETPEPSLLIPVALGMLGLVFYRKRRG
jgi:hypothetical protein